MTAAPNPSGPIQAFDAGIARQIGHYSDAVRVPAGYDQVIVSGRPCWLTGRDAGRPT